MGDKRVIHFEIVGKDGPALQKFYSDLFGWKLNTDNPGGYGMSDPAETGVVVGIGDSHDGGAGHVTGYVTVPDVDAALARVTELGGKVLMPKFNQGRWRGARPHRRPRGARHRPDRRPEPGPQTGHRPRAGRPIDRLVGLRPILRRCRSTASIHPPT